MSCYHPAVPKMKDPSWVDTTAGVREVAAACAEAGRFALDTEADSLHSYFHKVCLIQVTAGKRSFLIDPLALENDGLRPLWKVAAKPSVAVVMHGADYDVRVLDRDFEVRIRGLEDTQIMAQLLGEPKTGLATMLEQEFGVTLDKRHQRADWGRRPLDARLLAYAASDTLHLIGLAERLRRRLEKLGRWTWAVEEFRALERVRYSEPEPDPFAFERIKGARALKDQARDRLHALFQWRDSAARRRDLPPFKVLGNRQLLALAVGPPEDLEGMAKVPGLGPRFTRRSGKEVLRRLRKPGRAPNRARRERQPAPPAEVRRRADRLQKVRDSVAGELGIQPGLLCPRATLQAVAEAGPEHMAKAGLEGWRLGLLKERFSPAMTDR
jgi:ribonuclease D